MPDTLLYNNILIFIFSHEAASPEKIPVSARNGPTLP